MALTVALAVLLTVCPPGWECASLEGRLGNGERFEKSFGPGLTLLLEPGREFIFSPEVGRTIDYPLTPAQAEELPDFGRGLLAVKSMELGNLQQGERARIERLEFEVELRWPVSWSDDGQ